MTYIFFFLLAFSANALETASGAIEQAQALAIKKNRREACAILRKSLEGQGKSRARVLEQLNNISKIFFTDKGQKAYEAGQGEIFENPEVALNHFRQSLVLEDDNLSVLVSLARVSMMKQDCESAAAFIDRARVLNPYDAEAAVFEISALYCLKKSEAQREKIKSLPALNKWEEGFVQYLTAQDLLRQGQAKRSMDLLQKFSDENPQFPEAYFYLAKAGLEMKRDVDDWQERYISLCKSISVRERKKYALEPRLCVALKEVEDELAKSGRDF